MELKRCFVGIELPSEVVKEVARIQEVLWGFNFSGKLTELENLHLTLKFMGEISLDDVERVRGKLREVEFKVFEGSLGESGSFNFRGAPRIVWIKINGDGIFELQKKIDSLLEEIGFEKEGRFMSHLTIARVKFVLDNSAFRKYVSNLGVKKLKFKVDSFKLFESELREVGPAYRVIEDFGF